MMINWQAVIFDFDGVILDSVDVKTRAFEKLFSEYGTEIQKQIVQYHLDNMGMSRVVKFRYFLREIIDSPVDESKICELSKRFSELSVQGVLNSPFVTGAQSALKELKRQSIPSYVVSATPHDEINLIVKKKCLSLFFKEVHGSPPEKHEIAADIIFRYAYDASQCLFIGDSISDYSAAKTVGMNFLGVVKSNHQSPFSSDTFVSSKVEISF